MSSNRPRTGRSSLSRSPVFTNPQVPEGKGSRIGNQSVLVERQQTSKLVEDLQRLNLGGQRLCVSMDNNVGEEKLCASTEKVGVDGCDRSSDLEAVKGGFDLCTPSKSPAIQLKRSLFEINREKRLQARCSTLESRHFVVRPGMILLKTYLRHEDQVAIIKQCRELGLGPGGFYQPQYSDGAKLHLQMMCLGKNWDPDTNQYHDIRSFDGAKPPQIPEQFKKMVQNAMRAAHDLIQEKSKCRVEDVLPNLSPDLCIVNYYSNNGNLGLHQDKDESIDSLQRRLPVVSFSIGDSADFLHGDSREEVNTLKLESGDVLIFGGKSRHIFHGVSKIYPGTAPRNLVEETNLRRGRLNLTFRQY